MMRADAAAALLAELSELEAIAHGEGEGQLTPDELADQRAHVAVAIMRLVGSHTHSAADRLSRRAKEYADANARLDEHYRSKPWGRRRQAIRRRTARGSCYLSREIDQVTFFRNRTQGTCNL